MRDEGRVDGFRVGKKWYRVRTAASGDKNDAWEPGDSKERGHGVNYLRTEWDINPLLERILEKIRKGLRGGSGLPQ